MEDKQLIDAGELIRHGEAPAFESETPYIFVCPTYAWRIPRVFEAFLRAARFEGNGRAYFVMTCGDGVGGAQRFVAALCAEKGWQFMGLAQIVMPENYIAMFSVPAPEQALPIVRRADMAIAEVAGAVFAGERLPDSFRRPEGRAAFGAHPFVLPFFRQGGCFSHDGRLHRLRRVRARVHAQQRFSHGRPPRLGKKLHALHGLHLRLPAKGDRIRQKKRR